MDKKIRIMIVEDERLIADDLKEIVQQFGYEVTGIVVTGEEAIPHAVEDRPDLILMDIHLAGKIDGITAAEQIKARSDIPIIFLTAFATDETIARAKRIPPSGYILKPYSETQIRTSIDIAWYNHSLESKLKERDLDLASLNKDLERRVLERTREVEALLRQKDLFIEMIGHDLKTPLTPLHALLPVLYSHEQNPEFKEMISMLIKDTGYMRDIIKNVLTLATLNHGSPHTDLKELHLKTIALDAIRDHRFMIQQKNLTIHNRVGGDLVLVMNIRHLEAIVRNILENAVQYSHADGEIIISGESNEEGTIISISDTGIGIGPDEISHIFEEFYRADPSRHDRDLHGLGLSIVKKIVALYQGTVHAESPGKEEGSTFRVWIPRILLPDSQ